MSGASSNRILSIFKSRTTILDFMERLGYETVDYTTFSINEIDAMFVNSQLDMLIKDKSSDKKVYIKYYFSAKTGSRQIRPQTLDTIIEDLYEIEGVLAPPDTLIIIIDEEPNETILNKVKYLYERNGIFVVIHNIRRLQFNLLNHALNPKVEILDDAAVKDILVKYNLKNAQMLPEISRFDPLALAIALRPGQVAKFIRNSATALHQDYFRICV
jgi:DNA-directed RNA polymerase subunit H (RpoH/RPB5)